MDGKSLVLKTNNVYKHADLSIELADVRLPDGSQSELHIVEPRQREYVGTLVYDKNMGVLLLWRYSYANDAWGWEIPMGPVAKATEQLAKAAKRIVAEQTGWTVEDVKPTISSVRSRDIVSTVQLYTASTPKWNGPGRDKNDSGDMAWIPVNEIEKLIAKREIVDCVSQLAICHAIAFGLVQSMPHV